MASLYESAWPPAFEGLLVGAKVKVLKLGCTAWHLGTIKIVCADGMFMIQIQTRTVDARKKLMLATPL